MKKFDNSKRGTILYTLCHWYAFNLTAIKLHHWRPKYLLHDLDKPFLMLWFKNDYTKVRNFHKEHNRHHLRYKGKKGFDWWAMMIDWECSHLTKTEKPWRAAETMEIQIKNYPNLEKEIVKNIVPILISTGLYYVDEEWKEVKGYDGYLISNRGRVKSKSFRNTGVEKVLSNSKNKNGYIYCNLGKNNCVKISHLVAEAFLPKHGKEKTEVRHKNGLLDDDRVSNLEWVDGHNGLREKCNKSILQYDLKGNLINEFKSITIAAKETGCIRENIGKVCRGERKSTSGYIFKYKKEGC